MRRKAGAPAPVLRQAQRYQRPRSAPVVAKSSDAIEDQTKPPSEPSVAGETDDSTPTPALEQRFGDVEEPDFSDPAYQLDDVLLPRPLIPDANPTLRVSIADSSPQSVMMETMDTDDSPLDADDRTDIVWRKYCANDNAFSDFILSNFAGYDVVMYAYCGSSPYTHVVVTRPLTVNQMTRLDELVSFYHDPEDYWIYYRTTHHMLITGTADGEDSLMGTFLQPLAENEYITITAMSFVVQYWSDGENQDDFDLNLRVFNWSHGLELKDHTVTVEGYGSDHDPMYRKVMINGLGGAINTKHEHICQVYGSTSRAGAHFKIVGMQIMWGSREHIPLWM